MYFKNFRVNRKICVLTIICALTVLPTYAGDTSKNIELQKSVIEMRMDNLSTQYLDEVEKLFYKQRDLQEYDTALKTVNYLINASIKYYGINDSQTGFAYIARARYYTDVMIPDQAKKDLDKASEIYNQNKNNSDLKNNLLTSYMEYYTIIDQPYQKIKYLEELISSGISKEYTTNELGKVYSKMKNIKKAEEYYTQYFQIIKDQQNNEESLFKYHVLLAEMYQETKNLNAYKTEINKAEEILSNIGDRKNELEILLNNVKIQYFIDMKQFDYALSTLERNKEIISIYGEEYQKKIITQYYIDYFREQKDIKNFNKFANKINKFYETLPNESLLSLTLEEKQIDINKDINNFDKAIEYANDALKSIEPYKDYTPYLYGKYLRKMAEIKLAKGKSIEAKLYLDKAIESLKKCVPETAFEFFDIYKKYAECFQMQGNYDKAINYYKKAEGILKYLGIDNSNEVADIYSGLAKPYISLGKNQEAVDSSNKAVSIKENNYGKTHIKTIEEKLNQYNIYEAAGLHDDAINLLDEINSMFDRKEVIGKNKEINFRVNILNAYVLMEQQEYDNAIKNAKEALSNTITKQNKQEAYNVLHQIYSRTNNKWQAYKYKKLLEKIEKE